MTTTTKAPPAKGKLGQARAARQAAKKAPARPVKKAPAKAAAKRAPAKAAKVAATSPARAKPPATKLVTVPIYKIRARPENIRIKADGSDLVASIKAHGILAPLNLTYDEALQIYWVNAGARRLDGAKRAGLTSVPAMLDAGITGTAIQLAMLTENLQRADLSPLEEAKAYGTLVELGVTAEEIAAHLGYPDTRIKQRLKLLTLPEAAQTALHTGKLTIELAEQYTRLKNPKDVETAVKQHWSKHNVDGHLDKIKTAEAKSKLRKIALAAGAPLFAYTKVQYGSSGAPFVDGSTTEVLCPIRAEGGRVGSTVAAVKKALARPEVLGVAIKDGWYHSTPSLILIGKEKAPDWRIEQQVAAKADGPPQTPDEGEAEVIARITAQNRRRLADQHWDTFAREFKGVTIKVGELPDLMARWIIATTRDISGICHAVGVKTQNAAWGSDDDRVALVEHYQKSNAAERSRILTTIFVLDSAEEEVTVDGTPYPIFEPIARACGWTPIPDDAGAPETDNDVDGGVDE